MQVGMHTCKEQQGCFRVHFIRLVPQHLSPYHCSAHHPHSLLDGSPPLLLPAHLASPSVAAPVACEAGTVPWWPRPREKLVPRCRPSPGWRGE